MAAPLVLSDPRAEVAGLALLIIFFGANRAAGRARAGAADELRDRGTKVTIFLGQFAALLAAIAAAFVPATRLPVNPWLALALGSAVTLAGVAFRVWAIRTLGDFFTGDVALRPGHRLVTAGPYRWLRHPGYTGTLLALDGFGLVLDNWLSLLLLAGLSLLPYVRRIRVEEAALRERFGADFDRYAARRRRLVPGIW